MSEAQSTERFSFLGREFLTWLWFEGERRNGRVATETFGDVGVDFGQRLVLESGGDIREGSTVQAEAPTMTEEARTALRTGKKVRRAKILLDVGERHYELSLDAETLTFTGVKLPAVLGGDDPQKVDERLRLLDELESLVDELYLTFIKLRKDPVAWNEVSHAMRQWVAHGEVAAEVEAAAA